MARHAPPPRTRPDAAVRKGDRKVKSIRKSKSTVATDKRAAAVFRAPARRRRLWDRFGWYDVAVPAPFTSTRQAEALNTALVATHPPLSGPLLGVNVQTGQPETCDPHELYAQRRIGSPNVVILGGVAMGKSTLTKLQYVVRAIALGRQVVVFDRKVQQGKGEYHRAAQVCGGTVLPFSRRGGCTVNILDPRISTTSYQDSEGEDVVGQDELLEMVATQAHGALSSDERAALRAAHRKALREAAAAGRVAVLRDVVDALYEPDESAIPREHLSASGWVTVRDVFEWGRRLAQDLERYLEGDLSGLIDGETQGPDGKPLDLSAPLIVVDTSRLPEESPALSLVMAIMASYLASVWSMTVGQRLIIIEEGYHAARLPSVAAVFRALAKRGRGIGLSVVTVFHHISDVPVDSDMMSMIREAEIIHVFRQDKSTDAEAVINLFNFPAWVRPHLALLDQGVHIAKIGTEPPKLVNGVRTPLEEWITDTDAAMLGQEQGGELFAASAQSDELEDVLDVVDVAPVDPIPATV
ncbi:hypothetical protein [Cellulosimicrobium sp. 22601]|uniref:hypothetical protein n=1 Tax=Cellulosimicrobium sp. 22601 TaxID=3453949 RepID=UPI003F851E18